MSYELHCQSKPKITAVGREALESLFIKFRYWVSSSKKYSLTDQVSQELKSYCPHKADALLSSIVIKLYNYLFIDKLHVHFLLLIGVSQIYDTMSDT